MKRMMKTWALVAVAAMGLTACQNDIDEQIEVKDSVVVTFVTDSAESRTSVDTSGDKPVFSWDDSGETFKVLEQTNNSFVTATDVVFEKDEESGLATIKATFATNAGWNGYGYVTIHPESGIDMEKSATINLATLNLPENQYMYEVGTYDSDADLMVSEVVESEVQPTEAQSVRFTRLGAVVKMTLKNFTLEEGDKIEKVIFTADGKNLAGQIKTDLYDPHNFTAVENAVSSSVTINTTAYKDNEIFFVTLPTVLAAGDTYTVTVITNKYLYVKQGKIPAEKELKLGVGAVNRIGVNMKDVAKSDKWVLVKNASELKEGDVVTIAAKNYNYVIGKPSSSVYPLASQTEAIKVGNYLYHNPADATADHMLQSYTLMKRDENRNAFDFYNGVDFEGDTSVGFAWANGSNNTPKLQDFCDKNTLFDVTIADGVATITASYISGSYKYWRYYHATSATSRKFDLTSSAVTNDANKILLYKLEGAVGTIPTVAANVTVPDSDESVVIAEEGAAEATAIDAVVFNYVGPWTISVSDNAEWLEVSYADGKLYYTADVNTGAKREDTVTITASLEGQESLTWSFNVVQKGVPQEITIAEFLNKTQDYNTTYKLTGKITEIPTSVFGTFKLSDENGKIAQIKNLRMSEGGDYAKNVMALELGDIMTVTAVVTASKATSACGSDDYPSIYKGHYGIKASVGVAADYTGGDVAIEVTTRKGGSMTFPEAVVATMPESDYATLTYNGGDTATVTFTSENTTSDAREATVTFTYGDTSAEVTVEQGINPANRVGWNLVTDASTLKTGDEIVIVAKNVDKVLGCLASSSSATGVSNFPAVEVDKSGNVVYDVDKAGALVFTLKDGNSAGTFALQFTHKDTNYYLYAPSSGLKGRAASSGANDDTSYEIIIDATSGDATVKNARPKVVKYNNATGTTFLAYSSTAANATKDEFAICIYRK